MKSIKRIFALMMLTLLNVTFLFAQDGTYIEDLNVPDSSYLKPDPLLSEQGSGSNTTVIIIVAIIVIAVVAFFILRKKKK